MENKKDKINFEELDKLSDDEAIIELDKMIGKNDKIIETDYLSSLLEQDDRLLYFEVENIYRSHGNKSYRNRLSLKRNPPILKVKDDAGNEAEFNLTENFVDELSDTLKQVKRAYHGYGGPRDLDIPDNFLDRIVYNVKKQPLKLLLPIIILVIIILKIIS